MVITIKEVHCDNYVEVSSPHGVFCGNYFGENMCIGKKCNVEIDIPKIFAYCDFKVSDIQSFNIVTSNGITTLRGLVHEVDNNVIILRFGLDLIFIEITVDVNYQLLLNQYVSLTFDKVALYDTGTL